MCCPVCLSKTGFKKPFKLDFTYCPPTPNHNPLINVEPTDSLRNIHSITQFLTLFILNCEQGKLQLGKEETRGFLSIIECIADALRYEAYYRLSDNQDTQPEI